jgi:hypothetical protein
MFKLFYLYEFQEINAAVEDLDEAVPKYGPDELLKYLSALSTVFGK